MRRAAHHDPRVTNEIAQISWIMHWFIDIAETFDASFTLKTCITKSIFDSENFNHAWIWVVWLADENQMIRRLHFILQIGSFDSVLYYFMSMNFVVVIKNEFCCCFEYLFINRFYFHLMKYIWISNDVAYTFQLSLRFQNKINILMKILSQKRWKH